MEVIKIKKTKKRGCKKREGKLSNWTSKHLYCSNWCTLLYKS